MINNIFKKINEYIKKNNILLLCVTLYITLFCLVFWLLGNRCFEINNDALYQYEIFYKEWISILSKFISTGKFNTYSFNLFLGTDFYSTMMNYIGDVFLPIVLLFKGDISLALLVEIILCLYISSISMSLFLSKKGIIRKETIIYISLIYAIGGQATLFITNVMFYRFYAILPLLFLGTEIYFKSGKRTLFIIVAFILFISSYYLMYMTLIFLFFYSLFECLSNNYSIKEIVKHFFKLLFSLLIAFSMSCVVTLPAIVSISGNAASRHYNNHLFWEINSILGIFSSTIIPNPVSAIPTLFNLVYDSHGSEYNLFITIIPMSIILLNINDKNNRKRNVLLIILFIIAIIKPLNLLMHASIPSLRWLFLLYFYMLYLAAIYMDKENNKRKLFICMIGYIVINIIFVVILYLMGYAQVNTLTHIKFLICGFVINAIIAVIFLYSKKTGYFISILYVFITTIFTYNILNSHSYVPTILKSAVDYNQNYEPTYYRYFNSYKNSFDGSELDANSSILYDIMTTSTYCSSYDTTINKFIDLTNSVVSLDWNIEISNHDALTMLGTKYYIVGDRIKNDYSNLQYLEYAYSIDDYSNFDVYYNKDYRGFGYCAENIDFIDNYGKAPDKNFINTIYVDNDSLDISKYDNSSYSPLDVKYMGNNYVYAEITNKEKNILLIPFPNNKGWNIMVNGEETTPISVNGGFIGLELSEGYNEIEMRFSTPYIKIGALTSAVGLLLFLFVIIKENKRV